VVVAERGWSEAHWLRPDGAYLAASHFKSASRHMFAVRKLSHLIVDGHDTNYDLT
jgi:hypothetical protein